jgi:hypothetical protein
MVTSLLLSFSSLQVERRKKWVTIASLLSSHFPPLFVVVISFQIEIRKQKKRRCPLLLFSSFQAKKKKNIEKKMQRREGAYLSSLVSAFGMKHPSCLLLSTFLQH